MNEPHDFSGLALVAPKQVCRMGCGGPCQSRPKRRQFAPIDPPCAPLGARKLLHRLDKLEQPKCLGFFGPPGLKLLLVHAYPLQAVLKRQNAANSDTTDRFRLIRRKESHPM
jgi:hypothetical protein